MYILLVAMLQHTASQLLGLIRVLWRRAHPGADHLRPRVFVRLQRQRPARPRYQRARGAPTHTVAISCQQWSQHRKGTRSVIRTVPNTTTNDKKNNYRFAAARITVRWCQPRACCSPLVTGDTENFVWIKRLWRTNTHLHFQTSKH